MQNLFQFDLPKPLSPDGERVLREKLMMRRHRNVSFYDGIAVPWHNVQVLLVSKDEQTYQLVGRSYMPLDEKMLRNFRAQVAGIAQQAGSQDPRIIEALKRQTPREEGKILPPGRAAKKPRLINRILRRG